MYPKRYWALVGPPESSKSTFAAAVAKPPVYALNADGRFDQVRGLINGPVIIADRQFALDPLHIHDGAQAAAWEQAVETIIVDPVTRIYSVNSRRAGMMNRLGIRKTKDGYTDNKNRAAVMVDKADAMATLANLVSLGPDVFYIWHIRVGGRNAEGQLDERETISEMERANLAGSINVWLSFQRDDARGVFGVTVDKARDNNGRKANTGFTLWDKPGNFWAGTGDRLDRLIYTSFTGQDEAVKWGMEQLGNDDPGEIQGLYDHVKSETGPKTASEMWVAWVQHIDEISNN